MKFFFRRFQEHWRLTGFVGKNGRWFLGYSENKKVFTPKELADYFKQVNNTTISFKIELEDK